MLENADASKGIGIAGRSRIPVGSMRPTCEADWLRLVGFDRLGWFVPHPARVWGPSLRRWPARTEAVGVFASAGWEAQQGSGKEVCATGHSRCPVWVETESFPTLPGVFALDLEQLQQRKPGVQTALAAPDVSLRTVQRLLDRRIASSTTGGDLALDPSQARPALVRPAARPSQSSTAYWAPRHAPGTEDPSTRALGSPAPTRTGRGPSTRTLPTVLRPSRAIVSTAPPAHTGVQGSRDGVHVCLRCRGKRVQRRDESNQPARLVCRPRDRNALRSSVFDGRPSWLLLPLGRPRRDCCPSRPDAAKWSELLGKSLVTPSTARLPYRDRVDVM